MAGRNYALDAVFGLEATNVKERLHVRGERGRKGVGGELHGARLAVATGHKKQGGTSLDLRHRF